MVLPAPPIECAFPLWPLEIPVKHGVYWEAVMKLLQQHLNRNRFTNVNCFVCVINLTSHLSEQNFVYGRLERLFRNPEGCSRRSPVSLFVFVALIFCCDFSPVAITGRSPPPRSILFVSISRHLSSSPSVRCSPVLITCFSCLSRFPLISHCACVCVLVHLPTAVSVPVM